MSAAAGGSHAASSVPDSPFARCTHAIDGVEQATQLPPCPLAVIALVEARKPDRAGGAAAPWPWTTNVNGTGFFFDSKEQAVRVVGALQAQGVQFIDVGCMQINLLHHPRAFPSLDAAFDPQSNVSYAACFLQALRVQTGTWPRAAAACHSQMSALGADYLRRIMTLWPDGRLYDPAPGPYTPELASRIAADRAVLRRVLALHPSCEACHIDSRPAPVRHRVLAVPADGPGVVGVVAVMPTPHPSTPGGPICAGPSA